MAESTTVEEMISRLSRDIYPSHMNRDYFLSFFRRVLVSKTIKEQLKDYNLDKQHIEEIHAFVEKHIKIQELEQLINNCFEEIPIQIAQEINPHGMLIRKIPANFVSSLFRFLLYVSIFL